MQSSNQGGTSERRFDDNLEDFCWENGQLLVVTPIEKGESKRPTKSSTIACEFPMNMSPQSAAKDHTFKDDRRATNFPVHVPVVETLGWLDNSLDHEEAIAMQRNNMPASSYSYQVSERMNCRSFLQQDLSIGGDPEGVARTLCSPSICSGLLNVDAGVSIPINSTIQPSVIRERFDKSGDAMLNSLSSHCMISSPIQSLQNALFARSPGDAVVFNASHVDMMPNLQGVSKCGNSLASVDISRRPSDLESVLLDSSELTNMSFSCGSGHSPNKGSKPSNVSANKKARAKDDFDSESEGSYDDAVALKKPRLEQSGSTKRTRAADTHNLSERNRRGRINEKLKALQELIPNANKTDKASVLSETIDYLKKLRLQLQRMCSRNGMSVSPLLIPQGVQQLQGPCAGTGMNEGTEAAMGLGVNATFGSFQSYSLPPNVGSSAQFCLGSTGLPEVCASTEVPFTSTNSLHSSGVSSILGPTALTSPDTFLNSF